MHRCTLNRKSLLVVTAAFVLGGIFLVSSPSHAATKYESGTITTSTTWTSSNVYVIQGLTIGAGGTLTIKDGTVVKFAPETELDVAASGTLDVVGTKANPVYLTSLNDNSVGGTIASSTGNPAPGDWIQIESDAGASTTVTHAIIRYGGYSDGYTNEPGTDFYITGGTFNLSSSQVASGSNYGLYTDGGSVTITTSTLSNNGGNGVEENSAANTTVAITTSTLNNNGHYGLFEQGSSGILEVSGNDFLNNGEAAAEIDSSDGIGFIASSDSASGTDAGFEIDGTISTSTTWHKDLPYISANLIIASSGTLTINHGVVVKPLGYLYVQGQLNVQGTSTDPVYFTSINDNSVGNITSGNPSSTPSPGDWACIKNESGASTTITNAVIRYGGSTVCEYNDGDVVINGGTLTVSHSTIASSSAADVVATGGTVTITTSTIAAGSGIGASGAGNLALTTDTFYNIDGQDVNLDLGSGLNFIPSGDTDLDGERDSIRISRFHDVRGACHKHDMVSRRSSLWHQ